MSEIVDIKKIKIKKIQDYTISIDSKFNICFFNNEEKYKFPLVIKNGADVQIPKKDFILNNFLKNEVNEIKSSDATRLLKFLNISLTPFIWLIMSETNTDIFLDSKEFYVMSEETFISLSNKSLDMRILYRLSNSQHRSDVWGVYNEINNELHDFILKMISNKIYYSDLIKRESPEFKLKERDIENLLTSKEMDFPKILMSYEKLIRFKEAFVKHYFDLRPKEDIDMFYSQLQEIRRILTKHLIIDYVVTEN